jgi:hypothetical protein
MRGRGLKREREVRERGIVRRIVRGIEREGGLEREGS